MQTTSKQIGRGVHRRTVTVMSIPGGRAESVQHIVVCRTPPIECDGRLQPFVPRGHQSLPQSDKRHAPAVYACSNVTAVYGSRCPLSPHDMPRASPTAHLVGNIEHALLDLAVDLPRRVDEGLRHGTARHATVQQRPGTDGSMGTAPVHQRTGTCSSLRTTPEP